MFLREIASSKGPLSSKQKFELFAGESVAPSRFLSSAAGAGISQARNSLDGYGEGMSGPGKRFGSSVATAGGDHVFGNFGIAHAGPPRPPDPVYVPGAAGHPAV